MASRRKARSRTRKSNSRFEPRNWLRVIAIDTRKSGRSENGKKAHTKFRRSYPGEACGQSGVGQGRGRRVIQRGYCAASLRPATGSQIDAEGTRRIGWNATV